MTPEIKNKEKDMKKILLSFLAVFLIGALVISCDSNATTISDETATVSFTTSMGRSLSSSVTYTGFGELDWYYKAIAAEDAKFTHGQKTEWQSLSSLRATVELSQGFWTFNLQARNGDEVVFEGNKANVLIKKQATPISVEINVSPVAVGKGSIVLSGITIKGIDYTSDNRFSYNANKAVVTNKGDSSKVYNLNLGEDPVTQQVSAGNYSVKVSFEENGIVYGEETLDITVYSGSTVRISGNISEDSQSITFNPKLKDAPVTTFAKQLPVSTISNNNSEAIVDASNEENGMITIPNKDLVVSYPDGTPIVEANADDASKTADAKTGFVYKGNTPSPASGSISVSSSESVAQYELTLNVNPTNTTILVKVEKLIEKNLVITKVLHNGVELATTAAAEESSPREYYEYDKTSGKLTLFLFHASSIDIISLNNTSRFPENAQIVMNLEELQSALDELHDGDYIAFGANIVQDKVDTTSGQVWYSLADGVTGSVEVTIDLNGFVFDGQWGNFLGVPNLTVNILGVEKSVAEYYKHETGNHMVKACAVFNGESYGSEGYQTTVLKAGLFESNNLTVMAYGGKVIIDGAEIANTEAGGATIYTCNSPIVEILSGKLSCEQDGALFVLEPYEENEGPSIVIKGGEFDASKASCMLFVDGEDESILGSVVIEGGNFVLDGNSEDNVFIQSDNDVINKNRLQIKGGTFNIDPSNYLAKGYFAYKDGDKWQVGQKAMDVSFDEAEDAIKFCADCYNNPGSNHSAHKIYLSVVDGVAEVKQEGAWVSFSNLNWENKKYVLEYDVDLSALNNGSFVAFDSGETATWQDNHLAFKKEGSSFVAYNTLFKTSINDTTKIGVVGEKVHVTYTYSYSVEDKKLTMKMEIVDGTNSYSREKTVNSFNTEASLCWDVYKVDGESTIYAKLDNFVFGSIDL